MGWHKGDCHVRCVAKALNISWHEALKLEYESAVERCDSVGSANNIEAVLLKNGYQKGLIPREWTEARIKPTIKDFLNDHHNDDKDFVFKVQHHVAAAQKGVLYDTWDCGNESVYRYWFRKHPED